MGPPGMRRIFYAHGGRLQVAVDAWLSTLAGVEGTMLRGQLCDSAPQSQREFSLDFEVGDPKMTAVPELHYLFSILGIR